MPIFLFGCLVSLLGITTICSTIKGVISVSKIDILFISFQLYTIINVFFKSWPRFPSDHIYFSMSALLSFIVLRGLLSNNSTDKCLLALNVIVLVSVVQSLLGVYQIFNWAIQGKSTGTFINSGIYGGFLAIGCTSNVFFLISKRNTKYFPFYIGSFFLIMLGLYCSGSRTAWITSLLAVISVIALVFYRGNWKPKCRIRGLYLLILSAIFFFSLVSVLARMNLDSIQGRLLIWKVSFEMVKAAPFSGSGLHSFFTSYGDYQSSFFLQGLNTSAEMQIASMNYYAFNEPLKILTEEGLIGLLIFLLLIYKCFISVYKARDTCPLYGNVLPFLAIIISILIFGLFSYPFQDISITLFFTLSVVMIASIDNEKHTIQSRAWIKRFISATFLTFTILCAVKINALLVWREAKREILYQEGDSIKKYRHADIFLHNNGSFLFNYGSELLQIGQLNEALSMLKHASYYGNSVGLHITLANAYYAIGDKVSAENEYLKASNMNPKLFAPLYHLLLFYCKTEQHSKAIILANKIINKPIKIPSQAIENIKNSANSYLNNEY